MGGGSKEISLIKSMSSIIYEIVQNLLECEWNEDHFVS
jgi:hypothetical protein